MSGARAGDWLCVDRIADDNRNRALEIEDIPEGSAFCAGRSSVLVRGFSQ